MIVAHPDDESLFGGAAMLSERGWMVVCATRGDDRPRAAEFGAAMRLAGGIYEMWDYPDVYDRPLPDSLASRISRLLARRYRVVVTHGPDGEYGHPHHIQIHRVVAALTDDFYAFSVGEKLPDNLLVGKKHLLEVYKSQRDVCDKLWPTAERECLRHLKTGQIYPFLKNFSFPLDRERPGPYHSLRQQNGRKPRSPLDLRPFC